MASFELSAFIPVRDIQIVGAIDTPDQKTLQIGFWVNDPYQQIIWPSPTQHHEQHIPRQDFLWQQTCFELFIGIKNRDEYRELNLVPNVAWQAYQFDEYRYPEQIPPIIANDINLLQLQRTRFGCTATLDIEHFLKNFEIKLSDLFLGLSVVICTSKQQHFFAMQHSGQHADFHNKRDWLHYF